MHAETRLGLRGDGDENGKMGGYTKPRPQDPWPLTREFGDLDSSVWELALEFGRGSQAKDPRTWVRERVVVRAPCLSSLSLV
jgi:hypothetical protein